MAGADYISCKNCGNKIVYDGDWNGRGRLETFWGEHDDCLLCPDCIKELEMQNLHDFLGW